AILSFLMPPSPAVIYPLSLHDALPICGTPDPTPRTTGTPTCRAATARPRCRGVASRGFGRVAGPAAAPASSRRHSTNDECRSGRSEEHTSELQSRFDIVCRLLLEKKNK